MSDISDKLAREFARAAAATEKRMDGVWDKVVAAARGDVPSVAVEAGEQQ